MQHIRARILLTRVLRYALTKIFEKSVSQSTQNAPKRIEMQKKKKITPLTDYALRV